MTKVETRSQTSSLELREKTENESMGISGYAVRWNQLSDPIYEWFQERFDKYAFTESLKKDDQRALIGHDSNMVIGRRSAGTLRLTEDDVGLKFELDLPDTTQARDLYENIRLRNIDGVSFGFRPDVVEWDDSNKEMSIRTVKSAQLIEISPVAFPAYPQSSVSARSNDEYLNEFKQQKPDVLPPEEVLKIRKKLIDMQYA